MTFFSPLYLLLLLALVPLILMYLLKKEHEDIVVSSNYLWNRMLKDIEANKPWQKLRNNLLLILQALLIILLVLAMARPQIFKGNIKSENLIIVLDKSASMKTSESTGISRFETAKKQIEDLIKNSENGTKITIISMDNKATIEINSSSDKGLLRKKLGEVEVNDSSDNVKDTISLVKALIKDKTSWDVIFFTDKMISSDIKNLKVNEINSRRDNVSIDNLAFSKGDNSLTALSTVTNHSDQEQSFDISIYGDETILDVQEIVLKKKESRDIYFEGLDSSIKELRTEIDPDDALKTDNIRHSIVNSQSLKKVLIVSEEGNIFLEKSIGVSQSIEVYKSNEKVNEDLKGYDAYVFDGKLPENLPSDGSIIMFNPSSNSLFKVSEPIEKGEITLIDDELFRYVGLDFYIDKTKTIEGAPWLRPILKLDDKTIIGKGVINNQKIAAIAFDIRDTDLPLRIDFPIFIQNILDYTLNINNQEKTEVLSGEAIEINISPKAKEVFITDPGGKKTKLNGSSYSDTEKTGIYKIEQKTDGETIKSSFVSNIETSSESKDLDISIEVGESEKGNAEKVKSGKDIRNIILLLALIVISFEWVVYNRGY